MRIAMLATVLLLLLTACGGEPTRSTSNTIATTTPAISIPATQTRSVELTQVAAALAPTATSAATATVAASATTAATATAMRPPATNIPIRPTSTATPGKVEIVAQGVTNYRDTSGSLWFMGEVLNTGQTDAGSIQIAISLIGDTGQTLAVGSAGAFLQSLPILKPGQKAVWSTLIDKAPEAWKEERVQVQVGQVQSYERTLYYFDLKTDGVTLDPPTQFGGVKASGQIVNSGLGTAKNARVTIAMYDAEGKLLRVEDGYAKLDQIPPGGSAPFSIDAYTLKQVPPKFEIYVYSQK